MLVVTLIYTRVSDYNLGKSDRQECLLCKALFSLYNNI